PTPKLPQNSRSSRRASRPIAPHVTRSSATCRSARSKLATHSLTHRSDPAAIFVVLGIEQTVDLVVLPRPFVGRLINIREWNRRERSFRRRLCPKHGGSGEA